MLRSVGQEVAGILSKIHEECFPTYWNSDAFTGFFSVAGTRALVTDAADGIAGMIVWRVVGEQADIMTLAVLPPYRRQGMARLLVEQALAYAKNAGATTFFLDVEDGNTPAIRLYESYGFTVLRRRKLYYQKPDGSYTDALVMKKKIA